jgi:hypothetical protein
VTGKEDVYHTECRFGPIDESLFNLPLNELLEPEGKPEKDNDKHEPTEYIERPGERENVENIR